MRKVTILITSGAASLLAAGATLAQGPALPPGYEAYLPAALAASAALPAAAPDSLTDKADRAAFRALRALEGTPRWEMAKADAGRGVLPAFSCAAGKQLGPETTPALVRLLTRLRTDGINLTRAHAAAAPERPFRRDAGPTCLAEADVKPAREQPSLQAAWGWTIALILSETLPERAAPLLARGRAYGDSAMICGTASSSSVAQGRESGAALLALLHGDAGFSRDLAAARAELAALSTPAPEGCEAQAKVLATPLP